MATAITGEAKVESRAVPTTTNIARNTIAPLRVLYVAAFVRVAVLYATDCYCASPRPFGSVIIGYMVEGRDGYEVERVAVACRRCSDR